VMREYVACFNTARPHQGLGQRIPAGTEEAALRPQPDRQIQAVPVLGRLHHTYQRAA
jgi:hypothetical protein